MPNFTIRIVATIAAIVVAFGILWAAIHFYHKSQAQGAQSKIDTAQSGAFHNSAADAIATQGNRAAEDRASEDLSRSNEKEIRNAQGSDARVDPAARDAGLRAFCRRAAYRNDERCRVQQPHP